MREILRRWLKGLAVTTLKSIMCVQEWLNQFGYICRGSWFSWVCMMITRAADQVGDLRYTWSLWHCCTLVLITTGKTIPQVQLQLWFHRETRRLREKPWVGAVVKLAYSRFSSVKNVTKECRGTRPGLYCRPYGFLSRNRRRRLSQARVIHAQSQRPGRNQLKLPVRVTNSHIAHCHVRTNVQTKYWFPRNDIIRKCYFLLSSNFEFNRRLCLHPEVHLPKKCDNLNSAHLSSSDCLLSRF